MIAEPDDHTNEDHIRTGLGLEMTPEPLGEGVRAHGVARRAVLRVDELGLLVEE